MTTIARTHRTPTLSQIPFAIREVLARNARREARRERRRRFFSSLVTRHSSLPHTARLGRETVESNLPVIQASRLTSRAGVPPGRHHF